MKRLALLGLAFVLDAHAVPAPTGNDYLDLLRTNPVATAMYVKAFTDATLVATGLAQKAGASGDEFQKFSICLPHGATPDQAVDIVTKFIVDNPDIRERPLYLLTGTALLMVWSCG